MAWEQRWHPLREEWVTITSHRNTRPWSGSVVASDTGPLPRYVEDCYLCPGNTRISGEVNDRYETLFVFDNDHSSFGDGVRELTEAPDFYRNKAPVGLSRVICYGPEHHLTLAEMPLARIRALISLWCEQTRELASLAHINQVFIFENKGQVVGTSNPHPHGQVYATDIVFKTIETELKAKKKYHRQTGRLLFAEIIAAEQRDGRRIVVENSNCIAFVPWFARFPYETYIAPKASAPYIFELGDEALDDLAVTLKEVLVRYDNLWRMTFPYMMVLHQAPSDGESHPEYHFHIQIHPPLRRPDLQKFLASAETGGGAFLNDACPEDTAGELQAVASTHYRSAPEG